MSQPTENIFLNPAVSSGPAFYADPSLDAKTAGTCDLFMTLEKHSIQLALKERRSGRLLAVEIISGKSNENDWKQLLENITANSRMLRNYEFSKVTACITSPEYTLVPESLYKPGDEIIYFRKNYAFLSDKIIRAQQVPSFHLYSIFAVDHELEKELKHLFQDPRIWHISQALLAGIALQMKSETGKPVLLNKRGNQIDLLVSEKKKLLFLNSFVFTTNEDILYNLLFICEQLKINPDKDPLMVTGEIEADSAIYMLLYKYFRTVIFPEKPSSLLNIFTDGGLPFHKYSTLYNFSLCE